MAGQFKIEHKSSDGSLIQEEATTKEDVAATVVDDWISELEGDSGSTLTVTWED